MFQITHLLREEVVEVMVEAVEAVDVVAAAVVAVAVEHLMW